MSDKGRPLPKFGEWDANDPASAEGFTVIFNKARDEKKTGSNARETDSPGKEETAFRNEPCATKPRTVSILLHIYEAFCNRFGWLLARLLAILAGNIRAEIYRQQVYQLRGCRRNGFAACKHRLNLDGRGL